MGAELVAPKKPHGLHARRCKKPIIGEQHEKRALCLHGVSCRMHVGRGRARLRARDLDFERFVAGSPGRGTGKPGSHFAGGGVFGNGCLHGENGRPLRRRIVRRSPSFLPGIRHGRIREIRRQDLGSANHDLDAFRPRGVAGDCMGQSRHGPSPFRLRAMGMKSGMNPRGDPTPPGFPVCQCLAKCRLEVDAVPHEGPREACFLGLGNGGRGISNRWHPGGV